MFYNKKPDWSQSLKVVREQAIPLPEGRVFQTSAKALGQSTLGLWRSNKETKKKSGRR